MALIGSGAVATVYRTLTPGVRVVDVELTGDDGFSAVDQLEAWAKARGLWWLTLASGGGEGRHHIYLLTHEAGQDHEPALHAELDRLRTWYHVPATKLGLRRYVRPLSAPHRTAPAP